MFKNLVNNGVNILAKVSCLFFIFFSIQSLNIREGPVTRNQEAAQIFIKDIYDIVLEISFLDINSQNWIDGGHFEKKLQW